ncbi:MAG: hypothetical protein IJ724_03940 [Muribaculaceae bacterium]|nr:hypothetical protein [Muribaculaceae bacterium]
MGNTFQSGSVAVPGRARKVWREIRHQWPAGGKVKNIEDWFGAIIPAGTPCKYDGATKEVTCYTDTAVTGAADITTLGINGYTQEDIDCRAISAVATATVIYDGEIYDYFFSAAVLAKLKTVTTCPQVIFVH